MCTVKGPDNSSYGVPCQFGRGSEKGYPPAAKSGLCDDQMTATGSLLQGAKP